MYTQKSGIPIRNNFSLNEKANTFFDPASPTSEGSIFCFLFAKQFLKQLSAFAALNSAPPTLFKPIPVKHLPHPSPHSTKTLFVKVTKGTR